MRNSRKAVFLISRRTRSGSSTPGSSTMIRWFDASWMIGSATPNSLMRLSIVCLAWVTARARMLLMFSVFMVKTTRPSAELCAPPRQVLLGQGGDGVAAVRPDPGRSRRTCHLMRCPWRPVSFGVLGLIQQARHVGVGLRAERVLGVDLEDEVHAALEVELRG